MHGRSFLFYLPKHFICAREFQFPPFFLNLHCHIHVHLFLPKFPFHVPHPYSAQEHFSINPFRCCFVVHFLLAHIPCCFHHFAAQEPLNRRSITSASGATN
ncbi:unnamed protein product [Meloidogyne enterolobii]|uniref:Uncharacterized protein n=1 Tax=Meloidogyne enterolobii TaxID=390850 RepID=A0ACB0Y2G2_MELEN